VHDFLRDRAHQRAFEAAATVRADDDFVAVLCVAAVDDVIDGMTDTAVSGRSVLLRPVIFRARA
jgi:hypothetical protein